MDEVKLSDDVFEQIKDFNRRSLTEEQESLIDKLILNEELKNRYKLFGLCYECKQPNISFNCQACDFKYFQQNFKNWTSGNHDVDEFIQKTQLKAKHGYQLIEWIEYDEFEDIEYLAKGGFGITFKAIWREGPIKKYSQGKRRGRTEVALKCLHNSQDITADFLKEIESNILACDVFIVRCYGITKDPKTNNFVMVMQLQEADELFQSTLSSTGTLSYTTHPQAVYISKLLDFKNLPEPKNADNNEIEYSDTLKIDFTKLDINSKDESN
ncbi:kinase-like domain-containing protein [Rhizophagus irregularis DAOM 181602=DAOM 197198]|nr:kinase-like domain-containing protein [Rhizophagus irregularis DAOM 181602=DAOM 197198]